MSYYPQNEEGRLSVRDARKALRDSGLIGCTIYNQGGQDVVIPKRVLRDLLVGKDPEWDSGISEITIGPSQIVLRLDILGGY